MGWKVRFNRLGAVGKAMPRELADGVDEVSDAMARELKTTLWIDKGTVRRVTTAREQGKLHSEVAVGWYLGHGFYSGFQEFGVAAYGRAPRPIVTPTAHAYEPKYRLEMAEKVKDACDAT